MLSKKGAAKILSALQKRRRAAVNQRSFGLILKLVNELREARHARGISQCELSLRLGTSQANLSRMESGQLFNITIQTLFRWAEALGEWLEISVTRLGERTTSS